MTEEDISMLDDILKDEFDERPAAEKQPEPEKTFKPIAPEPTEDEAISDLLYAGTGPAPPAPASPEAAGPLFEFHTVPAARDSREPSPKAPEPEEDLQPASTIPAPQAKQRTRYFVIKSYSAENVTISLRRGIWATQKQNEQVFNDAFLDTPRVILLFSINGSRHFQGYARMTSLIQPKQHNRNRDFGGDVAKWGNTFSVSWERVGSVPFAETDHLRNPLAENLPLTRARDGQEVTERIGEELCRLIDHHSVPISPDLDFPITEQERECLMNDPRSFGSRGSLGNKSRGNRGGFEPYPARGRNAPLGPGGREEGRDRVFRPRIDGPLRGRREVTRRDERDDRWDDPHRTVADPLSPNQFPVPTRLQPCFELPAPEPICVLLTNTTTGCAVSGTILFSPSLPTNSLGHRQTTTLFVADFTPGGGGHGKATARRGPRYSTAAATAAR
eukprot:EG_transcript_3004